MKNYDEFKCLVGAYLGVQNMDEYDLKVYILKDIEKYIKEFLETNKITNINYSEEKRKIDEELTLKTKLQDALIVLPKVKAPMELIFMIKLRIKKINEEEQERFKKDYYERN